MNALTLSRAATVLMAGVVCFGLLVPLAIAHRHPWLAGGVTAVYACYVAANVLLWQRL